MSFIKIARQCAVCQLLAICFKSSDMHLHLYIYIYTRDECNSSSSLLHVQLLEALLHIMNTRVLGPAAHSLAPEVEDDSTGAPEEDQTHVQHDRRDVTVGDDPGSDELAETITPQILVDCDRHENAACNGLV